MARSEHVADKKRRRRLSLFAVYLLTTTPVIAYDSFGDVRTGVSDESEYQQPVMQYSDNGILLSENSRGGYLKESPYLMRRMNEPGVERPTRHPAEIPKPQYHATHKSHKPAAKTDSVPAEAAKTEDTIQAARVEAVAATPVEEIPVKGEKELEMPPMPGGESASDTAIQGKAHKAPRVIMEAMPIKMATAESVQRPIPKRTGPSVIIPQVNPTVEMQSPPPAVHAAEAVPVAAPAKEPISKEALTKQAEQRLIMILEGKAVPPGTLQMPKRPALPVQASAPKEMPRKASREDAPVMAHAAPRELPPVAEKTLPAPEVAPDSQQARALAKISEAIKALRSRDHPEALAPQKAEKAPPAVTEQTEPEHVLRMPPMPKATEAQPDEEKAPEPQVSDAAEQEPKSRFISSADEALLNAASREASNVEERPEDPKKFLQDASVVAPEMQTQSASPKKASPGIMVRKLAPVASPEMQEKSEMVHKKTISKKPVPLSQKESEPVTETPVVMAQEASKSEPKPETGPKQEAVLEEKKVQFLQVPKPEPSMQTAQPKPVAEEKESVAEQAEHVLKMPSPKTAETEDELTQGDRAWAAMFEKKEQPATPAKVKAKKEIPLVKQQAKPASPAVMEESLAPAAAPPAQDSAVTSTATTALDRLKEFQAAQAQRMQPPSVLDLPASQPAPQKHVIARIPVSKKIAPRRLIDTQEERAEATKTHVAQTPSPEVHVIRETPPVTMPQTLQPPPVPEEPYEPALSRQSQEILEKLPSGLGTPKPRKFEEPVDMEHRSTPDMEVKQGAVALHDAQGVKIQVKKPDININRYMEEGYNALMNGDLGTAMQRYQTVLEQDPEVTEAKFGLATTYHRMGELVMARDLYSEILTREPNNLEVLNNLLVLVGQESPREALTQLRKLGQRNPDFSPIPAQMAAIYSQLKDFDSAIKSIKQAVRIDPNNLAYRYNEAVLMDRAGRHEEAIALYVELKRAYDRGQDVPADMATIQERLTFLLSNRG